MIPVSMYLKSKIVQLRSYLDAVRSMKQDKPAAAVDEQVIPQMDIPEKERLCKRSRGRPRKEKS